MKLKGQHEQMIERTVFALLVIGFALVLFLVVNDWEKRRKKKEETGPIGLSPTNGGGLGTGGTGENRDGDTRESIGLDFGDAGGGGD